MKSGRTSTVFALQCVFYRYPPLAGPKWHPGRSNFSRDRRRMKPNFSSLPRALALASLVLATAFALSACKSQPEPTAVDPLAGLSLDIPASKFVLKNGLTVLVHEDHSAPHWWQ